MVIPSFLILFSLGRPKTAHAQWVTSDPITETQVTVTNVFEQIKNVAVEGVVVALSNGLNYFMSQLAYQLAISILGDCPGEKPCWDSFGERVVEDAAKGAVGEMVGSLAEDLAFTGFNLCNPSAAFTLKIQLGMMDEVKPPTPKCDFNELAKNWTAAYESLESGEFLDSLKPTFERGQSPISASVGIMGKTLEAQATSRFDKTLKKITDAAAGGGFQGIRDAVSGRVLAPPETTRQAFRRAEEQREKQPQEYTVAYTAGQVASRSIYTALATFISTFVQTLMSSLWNKFVTGLLSSEELEELQPDLIFTEEGVVRPPGRSGAARAKSQTMLVPRPRDAGVYDVLLDFSICPDVGRSANNCVIDEQFSTAIRVSEAFSITVGEAIEKGFLHGDWLLVSSIDREIDSDPLCYRTAYCESNLKKLRAARILPVGWEIAAHRSSGNSKITLQEVVNRFHDCPESGEIDEELFPFCHLIDPDWVIKAPPALCKARAVGPHLVDPDIPTRQERCVDAPTCLTQDDFGACIGGYGYCTRERRVWRFNGDQCPAAFNTCKTLKQRTGGPVSYLMNTIDSGICNADNAGCLNYSTELSVIRDCTLESTCDQEQGCLCPDPVDEPDAEIRCRVPNGALTCSSLVGDDKEPRDDWRQEPARYFNRNTTTCSPGDNGCTALVPLGTGSSLNLVRNGGFSDSENADRDESGNPDHAMHWTPYGCAGESCQAGAGAAPGYLARNYVRTFDGAETTLTAVNVGRINDASSTICTLNPAQPCDLELGCYCETTIGGEPYGCKAVKGTMSCTVTNVVMQDRVRIRPDRMISVWADFVSPSDGSTETHGAIILRLRDDMGQVIDVNDVSTSVFGDDFTRSCGVTTYGGDDVIKVAVDTSASDRATVGCTFLVSDPGVAFADLILYSNNYAGGAYVDRVQLEEGPPTQFHEKYGTASSMIYAKIPPPYLGCTGEATDPPECESFAGICRETEQGCELFSPVTGEPPVPGIVGLQDYCPAECVGYDVFKQEASEFESAEPYAYFIPSTAQGCNQAEVGCSEFTNLDTEEIEYYTRLRLCQRPDDTDSVIYYTWEGSDTTGYQLKVWNLKRTASLVSTAGGADAYDIRAEGGAGTAGYAPCTDIDADDNSCESPTNGTDTDAGFCTPTDIELGDFDCREFYDADGNRHYRRLSKTIIATSECYRYRITRSNSLDCVASNGDWERNECLYRAAPSESLACAPTSNECRAYKGNAASNVRQLIFSTFEEGLDGWTAAVSQVIQSPESVSVGGHSLRLPGGNPTELANLDVTELVTPGRAYNLSFWARGDGQFRASFVQDAGLGTAAFDAQNILYFSVNDDQVSTATVELEAGWKHYLLGPVIIPSAVSEGRDTIRRRSCLEAGPEGCLSPTDAWETSVYLQFKTEDGLLADVYLDNVLLTEVLDNIFVVRDSWSTPESCDQTITGNDSPQEMLGCREYTDSQGRKHFLRSFSQLCRERSVGCAAFSDTKNTPEVPYAQSFRAVCDLGHVCGTEPEDQTPACVCNYDTQDPTARLDAPRLLYDVCRVPMGESQCRFTLDNWDDSTAPTANPDRINIDADERLYLVVRPQNQCAATAAGCRNFGKPVIQYEDICTYRINGYPARCPDVDGCECVHDEIDTARCIVEQGAQNCRLFLEQGIVTEWTGLTLLDQPARYDEILCPQEAVRCEEFVGGDGTYYFKHPGNKTCEFKESVTFGGVRRSGWFRKSESGSLFPCYPELLRNGTVYEISRNSDMTCSLPDGPDQGSQPDTCEEETGCFCMVTVGEPGNESEVIACRVAEGNTTCGYQGWVGVCPSEYDRCEEYKDPIASSAANPEGEPYYYINNNKLDFASCAGGASLKDSCVLLKQTSDTYNGFSSAATYLKSEMQQGIAVTPVNCNISGNERPEECKYRCFRIQDGSCSGTRENCRNDSDCGGGEICEGEPFYTTGCRIENSNADCDTNMSEICVGEDDPQFLIRFPEHAENYRNDTNRIIKVRPDRECAQWLACKQQETIWQEEEREWQNICSAFTLCEEGAELGRIGVECSAPVDPPKKLLTASEYMSRDIRYSGLEYSGFSLVGKYPAQYLSPFKITTGRCKDINSGEDYDAGGGSYTYCRTTDQCPDGTFCGPSLSGVCAGGDREYASCEVNADCPNGYCVTSELLTKRFGVNITACRGICSGGGNAGKPCVYDDQCPGSSCDTTMMGRPCGSDGDCNGTADTCALYCETDEDCPLDETRIAADGVSTGFCFEHRCMYSLEGGPIALETLDYAPTCRAYPETDSPYSYEVVAETGFGGHVQGFDQYGNAVGRVKGYDGAYTCMYGNYCECGYVRLGYGQAGVLTKFYSLANPQKSLGTSGGGMQISSGVPLGICVGGEYEGKPCSETGDTAEGCGDPAEGGGQCNFLSRYSRALGWPGLCIDSDTSTTINGSKDLYDCNLWLPVDRLSGMTDIFNQYREAGFNPERSQLLYCAYAEGNEEGQDYEVELHAYEGASGHNDYPSPCKTRSDYCYEDDDTDCPTTSHNYGVLNGRNCKADGCIPHAKVDAPWPLDDGEFEGADACEDAGYHMYNSICIPVMIGAALISGPWGSVGSGTACYAAMWETCENSQNEVCEGGDTVPWSDPACSSPGRLFNVSWEDAKVKHYCLPNQWDDFKKHQITAIEIRFGVIGEGDAYMYLTSDDEVSNGEWREAYNWDGNPDWGLNSGAAGTHIDGSTSGTCITMINKKRDGDGYEGTCEAREDNDNSNCVGVVAVFNGNEELTDIYTALCHNDSTIYHHVPAGIKLLLRENCTHFLHVHDSTGGSSPDGEFTNVAWTDRIWKASGAHGGTEEEPSGFDPGSIFDYVHNTDGPPPDGPLEDTEMSPYAPLTPDPSDTLWTTLTYPIPVYEEEYGSEWTNISSERYMNDDQKSVYSMVATDPLQTETYLAGYPYACDDDCGSSYLSDQSYQTGRNRIMRMFAVAWKLHTWNEDYDLDDQYGQYGTTEPGNNSGAPAEDMRWSYVTTDTVPQIVTVNDSQPCKSEAECLEGGSGITVYGPDSVVGLTSGIVPISGSGKVTLRYYGYADKDHMPIRRKIVDFGDGTDPVVTWGYYKNHRGAQDADLDGTLESICNPQDVAEKEWGLTTQACEKAYFQETKIYTCSEPIAAQLPACDGERIFPCRGSSGDCFFKPRIQLLDNWGACNGVCPGGSDNGDACFNATLEIDSPDMIDEINEECHRLNEPLDDLIPYEPSNGRTPWTAFAGMIRVCVGDGVCPSSGP
ncbi:hypothetical protein AMJ57_00320 [Parcubacteria bacterium SG8_24]|nr:MAG: hypothetical protein AMJ57_00320 [Parcubacteria bacterium SG8_24]